MSDYKEKLIKDLPQQYKYRPKIESLIKVIGAQMDALLEFYGQLKLNRFITTATGNQLDVIGNILVLSRIDAREILGTTGTVDDESYRKLLIYKAELNFGDGTYRSIMNCLKIIDEDTFGFYYVEEIDHPATLILQTDESPLSENVAEMLKTNIPRAGGVGLIIRALEQADLEFGVGIASIVTATVEDETPAVDVENDIIVLADENDTMLVDENMNFLIDASSNLLGT